MSLDSLNTAAAATATLMKPSVTVVSPSPPVTPAVAVAAGDGMNMSVPQPQQGKVKKSTTAPRFAWKYNNVITSVKGHSRIEIAHNENYQDYAFIEVLQKAKTPPWKAAYGKMNEVWNAIMLDCQSFVDPTGNNPLGTVKVVTLQARLNKYKVVSGIMSDKVGDGNESDATDYDEDGYGKRNTIRQHILDGIKWIVAEVLASDEKNEQEKEEHRINSEEEFSKMEMVKNAAVGRLKLGLANNTKKNTDENKANSSSRNNAKKSGGVSGVSLATVYAEHSRQKLEATKVKVEAQKEIKLEREKRKLMQVEVDKEKEENERKRLEMMNTMFNQMTEFMKQNQNNQH